MDDMICKQVYKVDMATVSSWHAGATCNYYNKYYYYYYDYYYYYYKYYYYYYYYYHDYYYYCQDCYYSVVVLV